MLPVTWFPCGEFWQQQVWCCSTLRTRPHRTVPGQACGPNAVCGDESPRHLWCCTTGPRWLASPPGRPTSVDSTGHRSPPCSASPVHSVMGRVLGSLCNSHRCRACVYGNASHCPHHEQTMNSYQAWFQSLGRGKCHRDYLDKAASFRLLHVWFFQKTTWKPVKGLCQYFYFSHR